MRRKTFLLLFALAVPATLLSACVVEERRGGREVVVAAAPPPLRVEPAPPAPRPPEFVEWRPGHWRWDGREYVWNAGEWIERPHRAAVWEPGRWVERRGGWVWVDGRWR